jgi:hypothetical protein
MMGWFRRRCGERSPQLRYHPRCAACGHNTDLVPIAMPFQVNFNRERCVLEVHCPRCGFIWDRGLNDEERITLLLNEVEEPSYEG